MKVKSDVLIIGAGIMGASCAFRLSEQGLTVIVLEAQTSPATGSTGRSVAGVRVQYTEEVNARISWESIQEYQHFQELYGEDAGYRPIGYLFLVPPERWSEHLQSVRLQERIGAPVRVLSVEDAQNLIAFDTTGIAGTTHGPADGVVDPHSVTFAYLKLAKEKGASLYLETPLTSAKRLGNVWQVETPKGWFEPTISVGLERFPWLEETRLDSQACWWGYYEVTPDHNPILGRLPTVENWVNVAGFSGHGVQQAPAIGRLIAEEVVLGKAQSINIDPLRITRFSTGQQSWERNIV